MRPHILITRSLPRALVHRLKAADLKVTEADFTRKVILHPEKNNHRMPHGVVVLTSKTAVTAWIGIAKQIGTDIQKHRIFCLAHATKDEALKNQLPVAGTALTAAALAGVIAGDPNIRQVTFVCGNLRRDELPELLKNRGVQVDEWTGYRTEFTPVKLEAAVDGILFFSPSAIDSFLTLNPVNTATCFCIGGTTAEYARKACFKSICVADTPTSESLVNAVIHFYSKKIKS